MKQKFPRFQRRQQPFYGMFGRAEKKIPPPDSFPGNLIVHVVRQSNRTGIFVDSHACDATCIFCLRDWIWLYASHHHAEVLQTFTTCVTCDDRLECLVDPDNERVPITNK